MVGYKYITSDMVVDVISGQEIEDEILEKIINHALLAVDERIKEIDTPGKEDKGLIGQ